MTSQGCANGVLVSLEVSYYSFKIMIKKELKCFIDNV